MARIEVKRKVSEQTRKCWSGETVGYSGVNQGGSGVGGCWWTRGKKAMDVGRISAFAGGRKLCNCEKNKKRKT